MDIPEAERLKSRVMGEGRPSVSGHDESGEVGTQAGVQGIENPHEIESVNSGARVRGRTVDTKLDKAAGTSPQGVSDTGSSSPKSGAAGEVGIRIQDADSVDRVTDSSGAEGTDNVDILKEGDPRHKENDPSLLGTAEAAGTTEDQYLSPSFTNMARPPSPDKSTDSHRINMPLSKGEELDSFKEFPVPRTTSNFSVESAGGDQCRICQQHTEEPLMELGCHCRGELAKAHRSCVDHWFGNKGTNKCEVCQHVATNVPAPSSQPTELTSDICREVEWPTAREAHDAEPHFWVWRVGGGPYSGATPRRAGGVGPLRLTPLPVRPVLLMTLRRHPTIMLLWLILFAFMAYLFVDVTDSASIGYAAMPIGFLFGVLVVLGLGTAARLVLECWHERVIRRNIQRMEEEHNFEDFPAEHPVHIHGDPVEGQPSSNVPPQPGAVQGAAGAVHAETTASNVPPQPGAVQQATGAPHAETTAPNMAPTTS